MSGVSTFDCAHMCFAKRHPPFCTGEVTRFFGCSSSLASCVLFCEAPPPFARLAGMMTCGLLLNVACLRGLVPSLRRQGFPPVAPAVGFLLGYLQLFSRRGSRLAFGFRATGLSTRRSGDGIFVFWEVELRGAKTSIGFAPRAHFFQALTACFSRQ